MKVVLDIQPSEMDRLIGGISEISNPQIGSILIALPCPMIMTDGDDGTDLHWAAKDGNERMAKRLIKEDPSIIYRANINKETPLHIAVQNEHKNIVKILVKEDRLLVLKENNMGQTALHLASMEGNEELVKILLAPLILADFFTTTKNFFVELCYFPTVCCCCNCCCDEEDGRYNPLDKIWNYRFYKVTRESISNLINKEDKEGYSAFDLATISGHHKTVKTLLENYFNVGYRDIVKALNIAVIHGHKKTADLLLAEIDYYETALTNAALYGYERAAEVIIAKIPKFSENFNANNWDYLHYAVMNGHEKMVGLLIDKIPMPGREYEITICRVLDLAIRNGQKVVMHTAAENNHKNLVTMLQSKIPLDIVIKELTALNKTDYLKEFVKLFQDHLKEYMANDAIAIICDYINDSNVKIHFSKLLSTQRANNTICPLIYSQPNNNSIVELTVLEVQDEEPDINGSINYKCFRRTR